MDIDSGRIVTLVPTDEAQSSMPGWPALARTNVPDSLDGTGGGAACAAGDAVMTAVMMAVALRAATIMLRSLRRALDDGLCGTSNSFTVSCLTAPEWCSPGH